MSIVGFRSLSEMEESSRPSASRPRCKADSLTTLVTGPGDPFRVEAWVDALSEQTFRSLTLPLPLGTAKALLRARDSSRLSLFVEMQEEGSRPDTTTRTLPPPTVDEEEAAALAGLAEAIDGAIATLGGPVFVRLSSRSPKDVALHAPKTRHLIARELDLQDSAAAAHQRAFDAPGVVDTLSPRDLAETAESVALVRAISLVLAVDTGAEAVDMLSRSTRVYEDISTAELLLQEAFDLAIVVRKWEVVEPELEFRTFVVNDAVVAITQYTSNVFIPWMAAHADAIRDAIVAYHQRVVRDQFRTATGGSVESYVMDVVLGYVPVDELESSIRLVEINNPPPVAGSGMFDWQDEGDRALLTSDLAPDALPTIRVQTAPVPTLERYAPGPLKRFIDRLRSRPAGEGEATHPGVVCSGCGMDPIIGSAFSCTACDAVLCEFCRSDRTHPPEHLFLVIPTDDNGSDGGDDVAAANDGAAAWCTLL